MHVRDNVFDYIGYIILFFSNTIEIGNENYHFGISILKENLHWNFLKYVSTKYSMFFGE